MISLGFIINQCDSFKKDILTKNYQKGLKGIANLNKKHKFWNSLHV